MSILLQMTLFLAAALIIVPLGMRFGIASVLGYLLTGILLGPSVFNIANDATAIMHLADFGVILLMFLIGLELRPQRLWQMRQAILLWGSWQVLATAALLLMALLLLLDLPVLMSLIIALALALSSTAFVLQMLSEKQQLHSSFGQQSFAILLLQDIAAILLLALIPIVAGTAQQNSGHGIAYFAAIVACFSGLFLFSRYVMRPFFRYVASSGAHELLTAAALFIVLAVVVLMDTLGISTTLGAFITGVMLADSEFRHQLEASIAPFKGLLLGLFFMTVGFATPLALLWSDPLWIMTAALALMFVKGLVLFVIGRFSQLNWRDSLLLAVCLAQGGEFAFVVMNVAVSEQVLLQSLLAPVNLVVIVSMILTPLFYWLVAEKILPRFANSANSSNSNFDAIPEHQHQIIIAGFNRFGQIIARVAHMQHLPFTAIDNNLAQIDFVRRYGGTLYYGDVTHSDILRAAGVAQAKIFVLAINDPIDSIKVVQYLTMHHPHLTLLVRARDRQHVHLLRELGVQHIWREHLGSALEMATALLTAMGLSENQAAEKVAIFRQFDEKLLDDQQSLYTDFDKIVESTRSAFVELEHLFAAEARYQQQQPTQTHHSVASKMANNTERDAEPKDGPLT